MSDASHVKILALRITGPEAKVRELLARHPAEPDTVKRDGDEVSIEIHLPEALLADIDRDALHVEVLHDASARGRERQKEVGRGNRFEGGKRFEGLGTKTREEPR